MVLSSHHCYNIRRIMAICMQTVIDKPEYLLVINEFEYYMNAT